MRTFKTLVFKNKKDKLLGDYAVIYLGKFGGCNIPDLLTMDATIRKLENIYPKLNFSMVKLVILKVSEIETVNT